MFNFSSVTKTTSGSAVTIVLSALIWLLLPTAVLAKNVLMETPLGNIEIELLEEDAPNTVANFLNYVENSRYDKAIVHRIVPDFIIQGGGFTFIEGEFDDVQSFPTVDNEFKVSNTRGTLAMAKLSGQPDSASGQWFINLADNSGGSSSLDSVNGGYTVFARVVSGMDVADAISLLPRWNATSVHGAFTDFPMIDFVAGNSIADENMVFTAMSVISEEEPFVMNAGLNDAWYDPATSGQGFFVTVFPDLNFVNLAWFTYDTDLPTEDETANLGDPGHRWITAIGSIEGNRSVMNINITSGGLFDTSTEVQNTDPVGSDGTITLTFDDCGNGTVDYDITSIDQQGSVPIVRVAADNEVMCEALAAPAGE
jgi:peptidyl-prolyl cis-trans isomerase A (cyclophilin A)